MAVLERLIVRLEQCETDTARCLGPHVAHRLGHWRNHVQTPARLAVFVRGLLYRTAVNGWSLHQKGGVSLEAIVIEFGPPVFTAADVQQARQTLGLASSQAIVRS